jgi:hypothetical protein
LITQRLTNDFQLMVMPALTGASPSASSSLRYQLSLGSDHHQIQLDRQTDNIQV